MKKLLPNKSFLVFSNVIAWSCVILLSLLSFKPSFTTLSGKHTQNAAEIKGNPVVHFEVGCKDLAKTTAFYTGIFGWTPTAAPYSSNLATNSANGIQGHITALGHEPDNYVTFYIEVDDLVDCLKRIETAGGKKIVGPIPIPGGKKFAWFKDRKGI